jgi:hypothetical protein
LQFRFFRRHQIWLPTVWGWLVLLIFVAAAVFAAASSANEFFAPNEPVPGARVLVVEGWLDPTDLDQAVAAFRRGRYERVVTTGGPTDLWGAAQGWKTYADRAASYLKEHGLANVPIVAVPAPRSAQDRTFLSAVMVREWAQRSGLKLAAVDLFSAGVHARRSRVLYRMALGSGVEVGVLSAMPQDFDPERWWTTSSGTKLLMSETISLAWTKCCFWPAPPGTHDERWGVRKTPK